MDAALQFLTSEHTVYGMTFQNWMLILLIIAVIWIAFNKATSN